LYPLSVAVEVIPCVDIQGGRAVRLLRGDPNEETVYFESPLEAARHWVHLGAGMVHLVDLDAATGRGSNRAIILGIAESLGVPVEVGGGVRDSSVANELLAGGVAQVVIGTVAVTKPTVIDQIISEHGAGSIVVSVDARHGKVAIRGWAETSEADAVAVAQRVWDQGVRTLIYTDVTRDGTLEGLDEQPLEAMRAAWPGRLVAGGGVATLADLDLLEKVGIEAAIVGRAIYEGTLPYPPSR
jgi:phosphoribosylformimino-5-aminoimidazole carboxamide ribotide isomerase